MWFIINKNVKRKESPACIFRGKGEIGGLPRQGFKHLLRDDSVADADNVGLET